MSAVRSMIRLLIVLIITLNLLGTAWAQETPYFSPASYPGTSLMYRLVSNGSVEFHENNQPVSRTSFLLHTTLDFSVAQRAQDGLIPFTGQLHLVDSSGLDLGGRSIEEPISGHMTTQGVIESVTTPVPLADLGIYLDDLLLGLVVPTPELPASSAPIEWRARFQRTHNRPQEMTLTADYTYQGLSDWGFRALPSVNGRFRADASFRSGVNRTIVQEIGHGIFYVQPSGIVEMSSVSLIITTETIEGGGKTTRVKTSLTTTLELIGFDRLDTTVEPVATPITSPSQPIVEPEQSEEAPPAEITAPSDVADVERPFTPDEDATVAIGEDHAVAPVEDPEEPPVEDAVAPVEDLVPPMEEPPATPEEPPFDQPASEDEKLGEPVASETFRYQDPAQRFELVLDRRWRVLSNNLTLRGTHLISPSTGEEAYIYVMPLPSPAATAASIARSALATYGETLPGFFVLSEPQPELVGGDLAYVASYQYVDDQGETVQEWALFTRKRDRAYYVEYAPGPGGTDQGLQGLLELRDGFVFGPEPRGIVPVKALEDSLRPYTNEGHHYQMLVPSLWPLTESVDGGSSTTFTEIGEHGYLTILVDRGAYGITINQILSAWRDEWSKEPDFRLDRDVSAAPLGTIPGATFTYTWRGPADQFWTRRVHGAVDDDTFYVVVIDYVTDGYPQREAIFDAMLASFEIKPIVDQDVETDPLEVDPAEEAPVDTKPEESTQPVEPTPVVPDPVDLTPPPFDEPESDTSVILLGRILTRYPGVDGTMIDEWGKNLEVTVLANQEEYHGVTDDLGYVYVANLPQIPDNRSYYVLRLDGPMLGFSDPVTVSFDNLMSLANTPRVSHLRTVIITMERDRSLTVEIVRQPATAPDALSAPAYFVQRYEDSAWAVHVQEMIQQGLE